MRFHPGVGRCLHGRPVLAAVPPVGHAPAVDSAFVESIAANPRTPHDDYSTYMAIDANSAFLETTLAHEFNHAAQASDDWWESALFFEMSATFVESLFDDGTHFARGGTWPAAVAHTNVDANGSDIQFDVELMTYGAAYLRVVNTGAEQRRFAVNLHSDEADVAWRLLLATGGDVVSTLTVPPQSSRVVIALALPADTATSHTLSYATRTARLLLSAL